MVETLRGTSLKKGYVCEPCALRIREMLCRRTESLDPRILHWQVPAKATSEELQCLPTYSTPT